MTSSMSTGERRWASARRGGMTVLGKVAVPKPINLPSQRLENHGLDPSVEIVPKGTFSWGSKSSLSASNAWGSSPLSPNTDGGIGSPSQLSGHASSAGSCTRPSTAGSDRTTEPSTNAWVPNSRPSSASGVLTSNQTSLTSLRPRSAETRPGSSQLSRFAEPLSENSVAWAAAATAEKLGLQSSKNEGFSLTSGDFPTLGSGIDNTGKNSELQDHSSHGRPGSSSGVAAPTKKEVETLEVGSCDVSVHSNGRSGPVNSWRRDDSRPSEDGIRSSEEKYQNEAQPFPSTGIHPHYYEPWHGPPANNPPGGVWYRGPPGGPPYGTPVAPGGFPMEPFPYYRPQIPAAAPINPQPVPPPGGVPRGHHPKNGDMYRPHVPNSYIRPGMPIRPGFYPSPVSFDSYYCPPMGYCNSSERDTPFFRMAAGPSVYNSYPSQNASDPNNSLARSGGYRSSCKTLASEQVDSGHPNDTRGPYKVLLKQHNSCDGKDGVRKREDSMTSDETYNEKSYQLRTPSENDWKADHKHHGNINPTKVAADEEAYQHGSDNRGNSFSGPIKIKSPENVATNILEVPQPAPAASKDSSLILKIEDLNAKARVSDGRHGVISQRNKSQDNDKSLESTTATEAVAYRCQGVQDKADHYGRERLDAQEFDGWRKRSPAADPSSTDPAVELEPSSNNVREATGKFRSYLQRKDEAESAPPMSNRDDFQTQRAKMRELAQQRVKQLQKEEEERISKQKANALAKLEELDRRAAEGSIKKSENAPTAALQTKQEESSDEPIFVAGKSGTPNWSLVSSPNVLAIVSGSTAKIDGSLVPSNEAPSLKTPNTVHKEHAVARNNSTTLQPAPECKLSVGSQQDVPNVEAAQHNNASHRYHGGASKLKRADYKPKQNIPAEKNPIKEVSASTAEASRHTDVPVHVTEYTEAVGNEFTLCPDTSLPVNSNVTAESLVHQRQKNNRNAKNKNKAEETPSVVELAPSASKETNVRKSPVESVKQNVLESKLDHSSVQSLTDSKDASHSSDHCSSFPNDEVHVRVNNPSKSRNSRRIYRNPQVGRMAERFHGENAVVWAPVRSQNKHEATDEDRHGSALEAFSPSGKSDMVQNNLKNKRAEIERYVPKSVAKEMAHQGSNQQSHSPVRPTVPDKTTGSSDSGIQGTESTRPTGAAMDKVRFMESRNGDVRRNKQEKAHGLHRQRGLAESRNAQDFQDGVSNTSNSSSFVQTSTEHQGTWNLDINSVNEQHIFYDENGAPDGWTIIPENTQSAAQVTVPVGKDQGVTVRGKRHAFKGHKGAGNNHDHKKRNSEDIGKIAPQMVQTDLPATSKDDRGVGELSSARWQPKSQAFSASNQLGSWPSSSQNTVAEVAKANTKEFSHQGQSVSRKNNAEEAPDVGNKVGKRERKTVLHKGRNGSPNQVSASAVEQAPANTDIQNEQHSSSGFRKNGNQNGRFGRGHESHGDWSSHVQESKQNNIPANQERQRHNLHYEYQPVGPYNNKKSNIEGPRENSHNTGPRFKERSQNQSRRGRGNYYPKQSGTIRVDAGYD